jgi:hypothetical protein
MQKKSLPAMDDWNFDLGCTVSGFAGDPVSTVQTPAYLARRSTPGAAGSFVLRLSRLIDPRHFERLRGVAATSKERRRRMMDSIAKATATASQR